MVEDDVFYEGPHENRVENSPGTGAAEGFEDGDLVAEVQPSMEKLPQTGPGLSQLNASLETILETVPEWEILREFRRAILYQTRAWTNFNKLVKG